MKTIKSLFTTSTGIQTILKIGIVILLFIAAIAPSNAQTLEEMQHKLDSIEKEYLQQQLHHSEIQKKYLECQVRLLELEKGLIRPINPNNSNNSTILPNTSTPNNLYNAYAPIRLMPKDKKPLYAAVPLTIAGTGLLAGGLYMYARNGGGFATPWEQRHSIIVLTLGSAMDFSALVLYIHQATKTARIRREHALQNAIQY